MYSRFANHIESISKLYMADLQTIYNQKANYI